MPARPTPEFDIILWGATGFTGRLVAEALARAPEAHRVRWALAGRDLAMLEQVREGLAAQDPTCAGLPLLLADARDAASLDALVARTRVVCTTVGPYARYGGPLVAACARAGVDACDLTGEVQWMRRMIDAHHAQARETGARIVHACGFDSIPSDLGVLMLQDFMRTHHQAHCTRVRLYAAQLRGGFSGGTVASLLQAVDEAAADRSVRRVLGNPYALDPEPRRRGPDGRDQLGVRYDPDLRGWTGPFVMASVNTRVVRRTHALLGFPWGQDFRYSEVASFAPGVRGLLTAAATSAGLGAFLAATRVPLLRRLLERRLLPAPGEGPPAEARERGSFRVQLVGEGRSAVTGRPVRLEGTVAARGDPGYAATSRMLAQSALCLALDALPREGGVLTPATSMGLRLIERLRGAGMTFEVREV